MPVHCLGINYYAHDAAAVLTRDGVPLFGTTEERLSRLKKDNRFSRKAIQACLDQAGIGLAEVDAIAFGWNAPGATPLATLKSAAIGDIPRRGEFVPRALGAIASELWRGNGRRDLERAFGPVPKDRLSFVDHHLAHAYSAYCPSGFDQAVVLVADGRGASQATTVYHGRGDELRRVRVIPYPNSIGFFYECFTDLLGFERHNDEWKVMGLAAYGTPREFLDDILEITADGYRLHPEKLMGKRWGDLSPLVVRFGPRRDPERKIADADRDLAASVQRATEQALFSVLRDAQRRVGSKDLCLAGGVAMNSKANGRVLASGMFDRMFIQPAATDDGTALGAALAAHHRLTGRMPRHQMHSAYLGPEYVNEQIEQTLQVFKVPYERCGDIAQVTARLLADGNIVGWFQGRMEFGPRALGNRSILADPRDPEMKNKVNDCIKFRENWRPFAPSVLLERLAEYFDPPLPSPFMILTHTVRPEKRAVIPAVTHADNTARIQTVERRVNPRYWALIDEFEKLTGVPVVMNTSFNLRGEPIVCEPKDAIRTFFSSGLDCLVLGDCLVSKSPQRQVRRDASARRNVVEPTRTGPPL